MDEARVGTSPARYRAFISYSHADGRFTAWLHRKLEAWRVPGQGRLAPIFIDRAELAAGPDLSGQVREALAGSAALVVIASPAARGSQWVTQEIALFRELHPDRPIFAALIAGEPGEAFPEALLHHHGAALEPLAADFRDGRDGKRLALLKIVAGLTAQPLDRVVQRDAQARQRRVMWITAGALLLSLVLAALLVVALRARAEADRQRAEAEGMVEFMLTDLRDKLKGVGRLDVMDAVNERAMAHYAGIDLRELPDESLTRRARLLQAMGEDDLRGGKYPKALVELTEAARTTSELSAREPDNTARLFLHAQSQYWLGDLAFLQRKKQDASIFWRDYRRMAGRLTQLQPAKAAWRREVGYSEANLCALALSEPADTATALDHCREAARIAQAEAAKAPGDMQAQLDLTSSLAWLADANLAGGRKEDALDLRLRQAALAQDLQSRFPSDARASEALMVAEIGLGKTQARLGMIAPARDTARRAKTIAAALALRDPQNFRWHDWKTQVEQLEIDITNRRSVSVVANK